MSYDLSAFPTLNKYATPVARPERPIVGREEEIDKLLAALERPEVSNAFLLGEAGSGKTMLVQGASMHDTDRLYLEIDLAKMAASENGEDGVVQMASRVKSLFDEAEQFKKELASDDSSGEMVMFIDEFHLLVQLSTAAAQAIKPALADSGRRGIKVIAATTYGEFHEFVENDQALMQRLVRINIREPSKEVVTSILRSVAKTHGVGDDIDMYDPSLYGLIYDYSNRYIPADSQPRKSILLLDAMVGWQRAFPGKYRMDRHLLGHIIYDNVGVKVSFQVDGRQIQKALNNRVFSQQFAVSAIEQRLQIAVADLHDKTRPMSSFLFTGSTGTGKTEMVKGLADLLFGDERAMIRFDMSEYALETSLDRFREELTSKVWNKSHSIVLFDEVEKANPAITRLMLQVLDDGRLTNAQGREISFLNTYIVLTTNAGSEIYKDISRYASSDDGAEGLSDYSKVIRQSLISNKSFAPEIINRMNAIIPFQPLSEKTYERILRAKLKKFVAEVKRVHNVDLVIAPDIIDYLVKETFDTDTDSGGARGLVSRMDVEVVSPVSRYINTHTHVRRIAVTIEGEMSIRNKTQLKSRARVKVGTLK